MQPQNAYFGREVIPVPKLISLKSVQSSKHASPIFVTESGIVNEEIW